jgi:hypothetical protein
MADDPVATVRAITEWIKCGIESDSLIVERFIGVKLSLRGWLSASAVHRCMDVMNLMLRYFVD